ncbi:LysR family transcriptional regulator [Paraburkholderia megapolitana]|uniref:LysR family transcriptional regulator n=1 Tax=Paraburkholderia megapolitana TaxID=420953 RepID=UPI0038BAEC1F
MHRSGLTELEAVLAVARLGNFRAAATELGMSPSALSQAIAGIEARLNVRLFHRTTRSVALTEAGEQFVGKIAPALSTIRDAIDAVNSHRQTPSGTLRINMAASAAHLILRPVVLEYLRRYPEMKVDMVTEGRLIDIVAGGYDAGVRLAETVPGDMIAVPLTTELRFAVVGSPAYFEQHPRPRTPDDLRNHACIRSRMPGGGLYRWEFAWKGEVLDVDVNGPLTLDESTLMLESARAGVGLAHLAEWHVARDIEQGSLVRVLEDWTPTFPGLSLYYPGRRHVPAGLRAFVDLIREVGPVSSAHEHA